MRIWFALLATPVLALADQSIAYAASGWACANQNAAPLHITHFAFLAACLAGTFAAWRAWKETSGGSADAVLERRRLLAGVALASAVLSSLVVAALWLPQWILSPCFA